MSMVCCLEYSNLLNILNTSNLSFVIYFFNVVGIITDPRSRCHKVLDLVNNN